MSDSSRIVKNVGILYVRMLIMAIATLYSSRIILEYLGIDGYGVFALVAGFITITAFLQSSMAISVQRNISYELGSGTKESVREIFATSAIIYCGLALIIILIASTVGYYFFVHYINIPKHLVFSSRILYFTTLFSVVTQFLAIPNSACFIAHENLLLTSVIEVSACIMNLAAIFTLGFFPYDMRLIYYGFMTLGVSALVLLFYIFAARHFYAECRYCIPKNRSYYKRIIIHAFWNVIPSISTALKLQGSTVLLNIYFGTTANSAYGIANQVNGAFSQFMYTIAKAVNPQLLLKYSAQKYGEINVLMRWSVKMIFFILFTLAMPILFETDYIFSLWLMNVPPHAVVFARLFIIILLIDSITNPLMTIMQATGKIGAYATTIAMIQLFILPVAYLFYKFANAPIETIFYVSICSSLLMFLTRTAFTYLRAHIDIWTYFTNVVFRILSVIALSIPVQFALHNAMPEGFLRFISTCFASVSLTIPMFLFILLSATERKQTGNFIAAIFVRIKRRIST